MLNWARDSDCIAGISAMYEPRAAVRNVLDARKANVSRVSKKSGITRQALYRALSKKGNPRLSTLHGILKAAGLRIVFEPEKKAA